MSDEEIKRNYERRELYRKQFKNGPAFLSDSVDDFADWEFSVFKKAPQGLNKRKQKAFYLKERFELQKRLYGLQLDGTIKIPCEKVKTPAEMTLEELQTLYNRVLATREFFKNSPVEIPAEIMNEKNKEIEEELTDLLKRINEAESIEKIDGK